MLEAPYMRREVKISGSTRLRMNDDVLGPREDVISRAHGTTDLYADARSEGGVCITHQISVAFRFPWAILVPVLALINKRALAADMDSLRRAIDEGHDLTARKRS